MIDNDDMQPPLLVIGRLGVVGTDRGHGHAWSPPRKGWHSKESAERRGYDAGFGIEMERSPAVEAGLRGSTATILPAEVSHATPTDLRFLLNRRRWHAGELSVQALAEEAESLGHDLLRYPLAAVLELTAGRHALGQLNLGPEWMTDDHSHKFGLPHPQPGDALLACGGPSLGTRGVRPGVTRSRGSTRRASVAVWCVRLDDLSCGGWRNDSAVLPGVSQAHAM